MAQLPPFPTFPTLIGHEVSLRKVENNDLRNLMPISFYNGIQATTIDEATGMQKKIDADYENGNSIHWAIWNNTTAELLGTCGYYRGFLNNQGELGCVLLPQFYQQGFMTHALQLAIRYGFFTMGLHRIWAVTDKKNRPAQLLLDRLQFEKSKEENGELLHYDIKRQQVIAVLQEKIYTD